MSPIHLEVLFRVLASSAVLAQDWLHTKKSAPCCAGRRQAIFCYTSPHNKQIRDLRSLLVILVDVYGSVNIDFFLAEDRFFGRATELGKSQEGREWQTAEGAKGSPCNFSRSALTSSPLTPLTLTRCRCPDPALLPGRNMRRGEERRGEERRGEERRGERERERESERERERKREGE